jgi:exopolysaccharide biosynthesis glucuronosyltransferase PssD
VSNNGISIFVTVGSELAFDRLVAAMDEWAAERKDAVVFAQIGPSVYRTRHIASAEYLEPDEYQRRVAQADLVVGHAGVGTILAAADAGKRLVAIPRKASLREARSDHQIATAQHLHTDCRMAVAWDASDLGATIDRALQCSAPAPCPSGASDSLLDALAVEVDSIDPLGPILLVASGGGHWAELKRCMGAFDSSRCVVITTRSFGRADVDCDRHFVVPEASRWSKRDLLRQAWEISGLVKRIRPRLVVSTGAAPGYWAIRFGKQRSARTVWIDSLANAAEISLSGRKAAHFSDRWLTQWPHLAVEGGPEFAGAVAEVKCVHDSV